MREKYRTGIPGHSDLGKVINEAAWGESKATERYGGGTRHPQMGDGDYNANKPMKLGDASNQQGNHYDNDVRNSWLRAASESAQGKPNFDPRGKDGLPKKW